MTARPDPAQTDYLLDELEKTAGSVARQIRAEVVALRAEQDRLSELNRILTRDYNALLVGSTHREDDLRAELAEATRSLPLRWDGEALARERAAREAAERELGDLRDLFDSMADDYGAAEEREKQLREAVNLALMHIEDRRALSAVRAALAPAAAADTGELSDWTYAELDAESAVADTKPDPYTDPTHATDLRREGMLPPAAADTTEDTDG